MHSITLPAPHTLSIRKTQIQASNTFPNKAHQPNTLFNPGLKKDAVHFGSSLQTDFAQGGHATKAGGESPGLRGSSNHVLPLIYFSARQSAKKSDPAASTLSQSKTKRKRSKKDTSETELAVSTLYARGKKAKEEGNLEKAKWLYGLANAKGLSKKANYNTPVEGLAVSTLYARGRKADRAGNHEEAERLYDLANAKKDPTGRRGRGRRANSNTPVEGLAFRTLQNKAKKAKEEGNLEEAERLYDLANAKRPSQAKKGVNAPRPVEGLAIRTLYARGKKAKEEGNLEEAERLYDLANAKRPSQAPTGRRRAKKDTLETELAVSTLYERGRKADRAGNHEEAKRLYGLANAKRPSQAKKGVNALANATGSLPAFFQASQEIPQWPNQLPVAGYGSTYQGQPPSGDSRSHNTGSQLGASNPFDLRGILENLDPYIAEELNDRLQIDNLHERLRRDEAFLGDAHLNMLEQTLASLPAFQRDDDQGRAGFAHLNPNAPFRDSLTDQITLASQEDLSTAQRPETPVNQWSERTFEINGTPARTFRDSNGNRIAYGENARKQGRFELLG